MENKHELENLMRSTMENLRDMIDVNTVIGDTIETADGNYIVPISKVSFGFASGGSEFGTLAKRDDFDKCNIDEDQPIYKYSTSFTQDSVLYNWLNEQFTKIVVGIDSEEELLELKKRLDETCIPHKLITDAGNTEFHGVPTVTCLGIGPYISEEIDKFTGNLPLL